ncbi:hypothetical protein EJ08DRAFT_596244 [Tothia fuscella]|uniref:Uncharacterized protein n=1 Tax=Tothia fuscella TaxID=1048955 RepID=A0A9P4NJ05_9PEZI|nr:hypothetical protein EJ08DRAFT_596244 [Tothia fuscella]
MWPSYTGNPGVIEKLPSPPIFQRPENIPKFGSDEETWSKETATLPVLIVPSHLQHAAPETQVAKPVEVINEKDAAKTKAAEGLKKAEVEKPTEISECASQNALAQNPLPALNTTFRVADDIVYSPAGPKPNQIVVVTATDGNGHNGGIDDIILQTSMNRKQYCAYHGYNYHFVNISQFDLEGAHPVWKKIPAIVDAFNTYPEAQWVFFLDLDAIIMNPKQDLNTLTLSHPGMQKSLDFGRQFTGSERTPLGVYMPSERDAHLQDIDMLIAQDHNGINAGSFFLRRSKYTQWLLDMWSDPFFMKMDWAGKEQDTLLHFIKHHRTFREHVGLLKQRVANAYPEGGDEMRWQKDDLVVHLAGCWVEDKCQERWQKFWKERIVV